MTHFSNWFLALLLLGKVGFAVAQNKDVIFKAKILENDTVVGINELVKIEFSGNVDFDQISVLPFKDFHTISGPTPAIFTNAATGTVVAKTNTASFFKSYYYILKPKRKGNLTIRSETIQFKNKTYKTLPQKIKVTDSVEVVNFVTRGMETAQEKIHLIAVMNTPSKIGDPLNVIYKLYFPHTIGLQRFGFIDIPEYKGFKKMDVPVTDYTPKEEVYKANNYRSIVLKKFVFSPEYAKRLVVEPLSIELFFEVHTLNLNDSGEWIYESLYCHLASKEEK